MATISASIFSALDGVVDPGVGNWHFPYFNEEMGSAVAETHDADVMLFGRVTYDSFAGAWPEREAAGGDDAAFAKRLGDMRKIVASRTPLEFTWRNSEQVQGDLVQAVAALKNDPAIQRIALSGSLSVVRQLLDAGLLDELQIHVAPLLLGGGVRLFDRGAAPVELKTTRVIESPLAAQCSGVSGQSPPVSSFTSAPASRSSATAAGAAGK